jgi:hypothetical protein
LREALRRADWSYSVFDPTYFFTKSGGRWDRSLNDQRASNFSILSACQQPVFGQWKSDRECDRRRLQEIALQLKKAVKPISR